MALPSMRVHEWQRPGYRLSTNPSLIDLQALNAALGSDQLYWAKQLSEPELRVLVERSVCFGVYALPSTDIHTDADKDGTPHELVGLARICTDYVTMAYLTDVYILPAHQSRGLGLWLLDCVREWWDMMPNGRRLFLVAGEGRAEEFYARRLGTARMEDEADENGERMGFRVFTARGRGRII